MKPKLDIITLDDVRSWKPCDPVEEYTFVPPDWKGTVFDILDCEQLSVEDRIWLVVREEVMELRDIRLFALRCAKRVEHLMQDDQRSKDALEVIERFLDGKATQKELESARKAANTAASAAARDAARAAARAAAWDAAWDAERNAQIQILKDILTS